MRAGMRCNVVNENSDLQHLALELLWRNLDSDLLAEIGNVSMTTYSS